MTIINAMMKLKDEQLVNRFDLIDDERARVFLPSGDSMVIYMAKDYIVGESAVVAASEISPQADFIVYNAWDRPTDLAKAKAKNRNIPLLHYSEFRKRLAHA